MLFKGIAIRKVMGRGEGRGGGWVQKHKTIYSSKSLSKIQNLPCHQQKKNPITGEDGDLPFYLKKLRVIIEQNQEIDSVNLTWR